MRCWGRVVKSPRPSWLTGLWALQVAWTTSTFTKSSIVTSSHLSKWSHVAQPSSCDWFFSLLLSLHVVFFSMLITHDDLVKISDFGTSKELSDKSTKMSFAGTVAWMAPEVIRNEPVSEKVDIWYVKLSNTPIYFSAQRRRHGLVILEQTGYYTGYSDTERLNWV